MKLFYYYSYSYPTEVSIMCDRCRDAGSNSSVEEFIIRPQKRAHSGDVIDYHLGKSCEGLLCTRLTFREPNPFQYVHMLIISAKVSVHIS